MKSTHSNIFIVRFIVSQKLFRQTFALYVNGSGFRVWRKEKGKKKHQQQPMLQKNATKLRSRTNHFELDNDLRFRLPN